MRAQSKERQLAEAFVTLADTMVDDYDVVDLLHTVVELCSSLLDATDAGILLPNSAGELEVAASSSERSHLIGLLQLGEDEGPCVDAYRTGVLVTVDDIAGSYARWPSFAIAAAESGYASMHAIPLRLRKETIGSLNLFRDRTGGFSEDDAVTARALADGATIGILHERSLRESNIARTQLQHALDSRVIIEQAKGVIAHTQNVDMDTAFQLIRARARDTRTRLSEVARHIVEHPFDTGVEPASGRRHPDQ
ncbi:GAF and ANTAR domain-containing protein [Leifsonia sp. LS-T14]|uniref:GAF and ANTAR domain-containing protein n=1 Tax=unclassified Leifsonia TaxID=2663824 RepID=UPI0035A69053